MPFRRKQIKIGLRKNGVKHSGTFQDNIGVASNAISQIILKTGGGPRSTDGGPQTIQSFASTDEDCRTADTVKYVNLYAQIGNRPNVGAAEDSQGWLEWAFVCVRENETAVPATNLGVQTLGDICTQMYRGECIFTGMMPVGNAQPVVQLIKLKIPKSKQRIKLGDEWRFITFFRAVDSASVGTTEMRIVKSFNYIVYS